MRNPHDHKTQIRFIARVLRHVLQDEGFESIADLKVALKAHLRVMHIRYAPADLDAALTQVASNTPLTRRPHAV